MRITSLTSRYSYYVAASLGVWLLPVIVFGATLNGDGCFERESNVMRMITPACTITVTGAVGEIVELTVENVDPDALLVTQANATVGTVRKRATLELTATLTTSSATITLTPWLEHSDDLWFIAISDNQARGTVESNPVFEDLLPLMEAVRPDFITNSGDLVQGSLDSATLGDMFDNVLAAVKDTAVPMYVTAGNHDYDASLSTYSDHFGLYDYSFDYGPARFVWLSTVGSTPRGRVSDDQLTWLESALVNHNQQLISIVHHPLVVPSWGNTQCCYEYSNERDALALVLSAAGVDQIISGHSQGYDERTLTSSEVNTITNPLKLLVTGGAGGNIAQPGGDYHFTLVHVTPDGITNQPFFLNDTILAIDASNNTGKSNTPTQTVEYKGTSDLPFIRLKFKVKADAPNYVVSDDMGNYWPTESQRFDGYTVVYATANLASNTTTTFTAQPATQLHVGTDQTINTMGYIEFVSTPTETAANTHISALPSAGTVSVTELSGSDGNYEWVVYPSDTTGETLYTISDVPSNREVVVTYEGRTRYRLRASSDGKVEFTIKNSKAGRKISVVTNFTPFSNELWTLPTAGSKAYLRAFNLDGYNVRNWYAFNQQVGTFKAKLGYISNATHSDVLVYRTESTSNHLETYNYTGQLLDSVSASGLPALGNLAGDARSELVVSLFNHLETYKWSTSKNEYVKINQLTLPRGTILRAFTLVHTSLITVQEVNKHLLFISYDWNGTTWQRQQRLRLPSGYDTIQLQACRCTHTGNDGLVVALSGKPNANATIQLYTMINHKWKRRKQLTLPTAEVAMLAAGQLEPGTQDTVLVLDAKHQVYTLRNTKRFQLKRASILLSDVNAIGLQQPIASQTANLVVTSLAPGASVTAYQWDESKKNYKALNRFSAYGSTYPGNVAALY